ncbi:MAG: hypothetical protein M3015_05770 [Bacteroidota bacterium]|nr:hypothetical protein [Bacteroidota bacterium]
MEKEFALDKIIHETFCMVCRRIFIILHFIVNDNNRENKNSGILTLDGVHLSKKGNQLIAEKMM